MLSPETEQWLRHGYQIRMSTEAVRRDLGEILAHGEPENGHRPGRGRRPGRPAHPRAARRRAGQPGDERARRGRDRRLRRPRTGGRMMSATETPERRASAEPAATADRGAARGPDPDPAAAAAALRRPAAPAPVALELQPLRPVPGGLASALHPRREDRADRSDVPRPAGRRGDHALLPAHPRPPASTSLSTRSRTRSGTAGKPPPRPSASSSGSPGRPTCARTARSSSASTRSSSPSAS